MAYKGLNISSQGAGIGNLYSVRELFYLEGKWTEEIVEKGILRIRGLRSRESQKRVS